MGLGCRRRKAAGLFPVWRAGLRLSGSWRSRPLWRPLHRPRFRIRVLLLERVSSVAVDGRVRRGPVRFAAPGPHEVDGRHVRGSVEVIRRSGGLLVVNELPLEDYVAGTLLGEVSEGFGDAVLRAQAVAIRTYALHGRSAPRRSPTTTSRPARARRSTSGSPANRAPRVPPSMPRAGRSSPSDGEPILAAFHSAAGGRTATAAEVWGRAVPYLVSVGVPGEEDSPGHLLARTVLARRSSATRSPRLGQRRRDRARRRGRGAHCERPQRAVRLRGSARHHDAVGRGAAPRARADRACAARSSRCGAPPTASSSWAPATAMASA